MTPLWSLLWILPGTLGFRPSGDTAEALEGILSIQVLGHAQMRRTDGRAKRSSMLQLQQGSAGGNVSNATALSANVSNATPEMLGLTVGPGSNVTQLPQLSQRNETAPNHAAQILAEDFDQRDLAAVQKHLEYIGTMLKRDTASFRLNAPVPRAELVEVDAKQAKQVAEGTTLLAKASGAGWLAGVEALVEWDAARSDRGERLDLDAGGVGSALLLAVQQNHADVVDFLVRRGASVAILGHNGLTPLETAIRSGFAESAKALLNESGSHGLNGLRVRLIQQSRNLPMLADRWPFGQSTTDGVGTLQRLVPQGLWPKADELEMVGPLPGDWLLLYKNRVMCALAETRHEEVTLRLGRLLVDQGFDSFARWYQLSVVLASVMVGVFGLLIFVAVRLRVFGWLDAPMSLSDVLPGAFDPVRLADPDFDPSRLADQLPYRGVKEHVSHALRPRGPSAWTFSLAFLGLFSSWALQFVRIPPEKDSFDEDYQSDEDDERRDLVREQRVVMARQVRSMEVACRVVLLVILLWWLYRTRRGMEAATLVLLSCYQAWVTATVSASMVPDASHVDAAAVSHALFSVQHGPRWGRSICTARGTASSASLNRRVSRRGRRRPHRPQQDEKETSDEPIEPDSEAKGFEDRLMQTDIMHVSHGAYLALVLTGLVPGFLALLWLFHLRPLAAPLDFYRGLQPAEIFAAYGGPGTLARSEAVVMELLLLAVCLGKVQDICNLLHVASLSLLQRRAAVQFVRQQLSENGHETNSVESFAARSEVALELSSLRWLVLREPVKAVLAITLGLLALAVALLLLRLAAPGIAVRATANLLFLALCCAGPAVITLAAAAQANREAEMLSTELISQVDKALSQVPADKEGDVAYVQLRVKSGEMLCSALVWPGGRPLGYWEPSLLLAMAGVAVGLATGT